MTPPGFRISLLSIGVSLCIAWAGAIPNTAAAQGRCEARIASVRDATITDYDPFEPSASAVESLRFRIQRVAWDETCSGVLTFFSPDAPARRLRGGRGDGLSYEVLNDVVGLIPIRNVVSPTNDGGVSFDFNGDETTIDGRVTIRIPVNQVAPAGSYRDVVDLRLFTQARGGSPREVDQRQADIQAEIQSRAAVNLALRPLGFEGGRTFATLDFGELESGELGTAFVQVRSTSGYRLDFTSRNNGKMTGPGPTGVRPEIDYRATIDDAPLNLEQSVGTQVFGAGPTPVRGLAHRLEVTIGEVEAAPAAAYEDVIWVHVTPVQ